MSAAPDPAYRESELVTALGAVRARIADACSAVGRDPQAVTPIAVTKTRPASDVATLARLGVLDVGESKDQEARAKIADLAAPPYPPVALRWHLVGRLQTNKAKSVASYAAAVHSLDRPKVARALAANVERPDPLDVFVQVSLDGDPQRGGAAPKAVPALAEVVAGLPQLRLRGVMAVLPIGTEADAGFARLHEISTRLRADHPGADAISAGMSGDLEAALRNGSTHVRVGSALLGRREQVFS